MTQYDTSQLDTVQHPVLGELKFPRTMPFQERNGIIDSMLAQQQSQPTPVVGTPTGPQYGPPVPMELRAQYGPEDVTTPKPLAAGAEKVYAKTRFSQDPIKWLGERAAAIEGSWLQIAPTVPGVGQLLGGMASGPAQLGYNLGKLGQDAPLHLADPEEIRRGGVPVSKLDPRAVAEDVRGLAGGAMGVSAPIGLAYSGLAGTAAGVADGLYGLLSDLGSIPIYGLAGDEIHTSLKAAGVPDVYAGLATDVITLAGIGLHGKTREEIVSARDRARMQIAHDVMTEVTRSHPNFDTYTPEQKNAAVHEAAQEVHVGYVAKAVEPPPAAPEPAFNRPGAVDMPDTVTERPAASETSPPLPEEPLPPSVPPMEVATPRSGPPEGYAPSAGAVGQPSTPDLDSLFHQATAATHSDQRVAAIRAIGAALDHPDEDVRKQASAIIQQMTTPPDVGPKPTKLRPGEELPRPLGQTIKTPLPPRPALAASDEPDEPESLTEQPPETVARPSASPVEPRKPAPAVKPRPEPVATPREPARADLLPPRLQAHLDRMAKLKKILTDVALPEAQKQRYLGEAKERQVAAKQEVLKWHKALLGNAPAALQNLRRQAELLGDASDPASLIGFLERSVAQHEQVNEIRKARSEERAKGKSSVAGGVKLGTEFGGPSEAMRQVWAEQEGKRRVEVTNWKTKLTELREGKSVPELQSTPEQQDLYAKYQQYRKELEVALPGSPEEEELGMTLKELEKTLVLNATRLHGRPKKVDIAPLVGKPVSEIESTGAGEALDPHAGLPYVTQQMWARHYGGAKHGARPTLAEKVAKLAELKTRKEQLLAVAKILEKLHSQAGFVSFGGKRGGGGKPPEPPKTIGGFYSFLEKTIFTKMPERASASQVAAIVKNMGVSRQEIEGTTFDTYLAKAIAENRTLTKSEVLEFVELNKLKFEVTVKERKERQDQAALQVAMAETARAFENAKGVLRELTGISDGEAQHVVHDIEYLIGTREVTTDIVKMTIRGSNYAGPLFVNVPDDAPSFTQSAKAIADYLITLFAELPFEELDDVGPKFETYTLPGGENYRERLVRKPGAVSGPFMGDSVRDLIGQGLPQGEAFERGAELHTQDYHSHHFDEPNILFHERLKDRVDVDGKKTLFVEEIQSDWATAVREAEGDEGLQRVRHDDSADTWRAVPKFPLSGTWHELALKDILKQAVEGGYEQIAWTTGEQQADRYNLRHHIIRADAKIINPIEERYDIRLYTSTGGILHQNGWTRKDAERVLGESNTTKLLEGPNNVAALAAGMHSYVTGLDVHVGGEHHIALYNQMIPQFLNRYTKKWGGRVGETVVPLPYPTREPGDVTIKAHPPGDYKTTVHSLEITPAMKQVILAEGQRLQGGFIKADVATGLAAAGTGAVIGAAAAGPIGAAVGAIAGVAGFAYVTRGYHQSRAAREKLAAHGVALVPTPKDMSLYARFAGSFSQQSHIHPSAQEASDLMLNKSIDLDVASRNVVARLNNSFNRLQKNQWETIVVPLLDNPAIIPENVHEYTTDINVKDAYIDIRDFLSDQRSRIIDARRRADVFLGFSVETAKKRTPDDWGMRKGYYPHVMPGDWKIEKQVTLPTGVTSWKPLSWNEDPETAVSHMQRTKDDAIGVIAKYLDQHPDAVLRYQQETIAPQAGATSNLKKLIDMAKEARELSLVEGDDLAEEVQEYASHAAAVAFGPKIGGRMFRSTLSRKMNLPGWVKDPDSFLQYALAAERYIHFVDARPQLIALRNDVARSFDNEKIITRLADLPRRHTSALLGAMDGAIEAFEGYPNALDTLLRAKLTRAGVDPNIINKYSALGMELEGMLKLGLNPASAITNLTQTIMTTHTALGPVYTAHGLKAFVSRKHKFLLEGNGIYPHPFKIDADTFTEYLKHYRIRKGSDLPAAMWNGAMRGSLFMFSQAEYANRAIAFLGAYKKATDAGMTHGQAQFAARKLVARTQFLPYKWDKPAALRALPRNVGQFKSFAFKAFEFVSGLKGIEWPRFLSSMFALGLLGMVGVDLLDQLFGLIGFRPVSWLKLHSGALGARLIRGGLAFIGIDITRNVGFTDAFMPRLQNALGPLLADFWNLAEAVPGFVHDSLHYGAGSEQNELAKQQFLRGLSPEGNRIWNLLMQDDDILRDPYTGKPILQDLTPFEKFLTGIGMVPLRVSIERDLAAEAKFLNDQYKDEMSYYVGEISKTMDALSNPKAPEWKLNFYQKRLDRLWLEVGEHPELGIKPSSIVNYMKDMQLDRETRDMLRSPNALKPNIIQLQEDAPDVNPSPQPAQ